MNGYQEVPNPEVYNPPQQPMVDPNSTPMQGSNVPIQSPYVNPPQQQGPPQQPGGYPVAPGGYPSSPGGYPNAPGGYGGNPYQGQGYANQQMPPVAVQPVYFEGIQFVYVKDPMQELNETTSCLIRQQPQFLEQITGCESPNRYYVFSQSPQAGMKLLFKCKEFSSCCQRHCCAANAREFIMDMKHVANVGCMDENFQNSFVHINRPFKCTCCCLERPEMIVNYSQGNQLVGRVKQPFTCCDPFFTVYDFSGSLRYYVHADYCQCGICCANNCCGKMSEAVFNIYKDANMTERCGFIVKKVANLSELLTSADSYQVNFPSDASPSEKILLIATTLMIDYQYFEQSANDNKNNNNASISIRI